MNRTRTVIRTVAVNLVLLLAVIGTLVAVPVGINLAYDTVSSFGLFSDSDGRHSLPNYNDIEWAKQHFDDLADISITYRDKIVWKVDPYESRTITVEADGLRRVVQTQTSRPAELLLFGGSSMWGFGTDDANTIPSLLAQFSLRHVESHAQPGNLTRQNLNTLVDRYATESPRTKINRTIVFYDGVNDVMAKCRTDDMGWGADEHSHGGNLSPLAMFRPALHLFAKVQDALDRRIFNTGYACDKDQARANTIARSLVNDWISADAIARQRGDRFLAVLQPVSFLSQTRLNHLNMNGEHWQEFAKQYHAVYPVIREYANEAFIEFYDLSEALDVDEYVYIDLCHLSQNGNRLIASALNNLITDSQ